MIIDPRHASQYFQLLEDGKRHGFRSITYVWQHEDGKGLPTAIAQAQPITRERRIVVTCGDILYENPITPAISDFMNQLEGSRIIGVHLPDSAGYSKIIVEQGLVHRIEPKDVNDHQPHLVDTGIFMHFPDVYEKIKSLKSSARGETEIWDLQEIYIARKNLHFTEIKGWWIDVGTSFKKYYQAVQKFTKI